MEAKKVNIDELIDALMDIRKFTEFVDITINDDNTVRLKKYVSNPPPKDYGEFPDDIEKLIV